MNFQQGYIRQNGVDWSESPLPLTEKQVIAYITGKGWTIETARNIIQQAKDSHKDGKTDGVPMTMFLRLRVFKL